MEIYFGISIFIIILIFGYLIFKKNTDNNNFNFERQLESVRTEFRDQLNNNTIQVSSQVKIITDSVKDSLDELRKTLKDNIDTQNTNINSRLNDVSGFVHKASSQFGEMKQFAEEIKNIGKDFSSFSEMFRSPKLRGGIGEIMLEELLKQELPPSSYEFQYEFKNQNKVDAVIKTSSGLLTIDSKFPYENFKKMYESQIDEEKNNFYKQFVIDVKKHIDSISKKYILPSENTFDFAFMYIPAENIFYETIIKNDDNEKSINNFCIEKRVIPVSPNTLYSHLRMVILGIKGKQVEARYHDFIANLNSLSKDLNNFEEDFDLLGKHLSNAQKTYEKSSKQLSKFETKLQITTDSTNQLENKNEN